MQLITETAARISANDRCQHPARIKAEAQVLHRMDWGGNRKIAKYLSRRHRIDLSEYTVCEWLRAIPRDLDPLTFLQAG